MGARISPGFTIIETVLFLSVTALLVMGVLIGTGSALNTQRYRDAVESFKDLLQTQYSDLGSVRNSRSNTWNCGASALPTTGGTVIRGQSDCLLVGKYMRINARDITIFTVLARPSASAPGDDIYKLRNNYTYNVSTTEKDTRSMDWGTEIAWPATGAGAQSPRTPRTIGILFIRSPDSGSIYTFSSNSISDDASINQATFTSMINPGVAVPGQTNRTICVLSSGLAPSGDTAVYLNAFAASGSAVEVRSNDYVTSIGGTAKC